MDEGISTGGKRFAVTGCPVLHSKSPRIFNTIFENLSIDAVYSRMSAADSEEAIFLFKELGLSGLNVTTPFKLAILDHLDAVDPAAAAIGAVNTVVEEDRRLKGYNTDYLGVTESLKEKGIHIAGKKCVILGTGGAGRAAIYGLLEERAEVTVFNHIHDRALQAAQAFKCRAEKMEMLGEVLKKSDILLSTLPPGVDIIRKEWLPPGLTVFDANYKKSLLTQKAKAMGCNVLRGEEWLLNQAIPAYRHFLDPGANDVFSTRLLGHLRKIIAVPPKRKFKNIALIGFMGSGKSEIGSSLSSKMKLGFKDTDDLIEKHAECSIPDIFSRMGEIVFRAMEKAILKRELTNNSGVVYACGGGVVLDKENLQVLRENALVIWLYSSLSSTIERIPPGTRPLLDCDNPGNEARQILSDRLPYYARAADLVIANEKKDVDQVASQIQEEIENTYSS